MISPSVILSSSDKYFRKFASGKCASSRTTSVSVPGSPYLSNVFPSFVGAFMAGALF